MTDYSARVDAYFLQGIAFESPAEKHRRKPCHSCPSTLTTKQADGRWGCWWHFSVQLELVA